MFVFEISTPTPIMQPNMQKYLVHMQTNHLQPKLQLNQWILTTLYMILFYFIAGSNFKCEREAYVGDFFS